MTLIDKSCKRVDWFTPPHVLDLVRSYSLATEGTNQIGFDPATNEENYTQAKMFFTRSGLDNYWPVAPTWVNPPYGKDLKKWVVRIGLYAEAGRHILALLPGNRFETAYLQHWILENPRLSALCFVRRRLKFCDANGVELNGSNPYGSMIYLFNGDAKEFAQRFEALGPCRRLEVIA